MKLSFSISVVLAACTLGFMDELTPAQTCNDPIPLIGDTVRIGPNTSTASDKYGTSVGISGDWAIGGAIEDAPGPNNRGFAIVHYRHQGGLDKWGEMKRLTSSDLDNFDEFGISSAISTLTGDYIIVGAHLEDANFITDSGSAYIFERNLGGQNNWGQVAKLTASDGDLGDTFGAAVAISGDLAIVSSPFDDVNGADSGSVYIFRRDGSGNWNFEAKFSGEAAGDNYGASVDIAYDALWDKHLAVVGSPFHDYPHSDDSESGSSTINTGAAYVIRYDPDLLIPAWVSDPVLDKLVAPDTFVLSEIYENAFFGLDIACWRSAGSDTTGDLIAVTAPEHHLAGTVPGSIPVITCPFGQGIGVNNQNGAAYVFRFNTVTQWDGTTLLPVGCDEAGFFGRAIDIEETRVIVTSLLDFTVGHIFVFVGPGNVWDERLTLDDVDAFSVNNDFGNAVALSGDTVMLAAHLEDEESAPGMPIDDLGRAYIYNGIGNCGGTGLIDTIEICLNSTLDTNGNDTLDVCEDCNNNGIFPDSDETALDCNGNFIPDSCDIVSGFSLDCNNNGVADECDPDCNQNGFPDECDIANGLALDCNTNGIPDRCEVKACRADIMPLCTVQPATPDVNIDDLVAVLNAFGPCAGCPEDFMPDYDPDAVPVPLAAGDGVVDIDELVEVLNNFGACTPGGNGANGFITLAQMNFSNGFMFADNSIDAASSALVSASWAANQAGSTPVDVFRLFAQVSGPLATLTYCGGGTNSGPNGTPEPLVLNPGKGAQFFIPLANSYSPVTVPILAIDGGPGNEWYQTQAFGTFIAMGTASSAIVPSKQGSIVALDTILTGSVNEANTGWSVSPVAGQGVIPDGNGGWHVLIGQFAVPRGEILTVAVRLVGDGIDIYETTNAVGLGN